MTQATSVSRQTSTTLGDSREFLGFKFPSADLLGAAASLFSQPVVRRYVTWGRTLPGVFSETAALREGPWPRLELGPGMTRFTRRNLVRQELAAGRREDARQAAIDREARALNAPMALAEFDWRVSAGRVIERWSPASRARLIRTILSLDLAPLVLGKSLPVMLTLTLPGRWLEVTPDAATAARKFANFRRAYEKKWETGAAWIWKREFQRRGAPHWHLWLVPPTDNLREFEEWVSEAWTTALQIEDERERELSRAAGTNVSRAEGMRARDPKRLAIYFLKESLGGEGKAYQNSVPAEWAGQSVGRFWGTVGLDQAVRVVDLDPAVAPTVWRLMRKVRQSHGATREHSVDRVDMRSGTVRSRRVRRRVKVRGAAGWIAVMDGAAFAEQLERAIREPEPPPPPSTPRQLRIVELRQKFGRLTV